MIKPPYGKVTDFGDLLHVEQWLVKGKRPGLRWHVGVPRKTTASDRFDSGGAIPATGRIDLIMDLQADKKVTLSLEWTDEMGNPTEAPAGASATFTVDDSSIINLTDNGDGTAVAAAVGVLGSATVHVDATAPGVAPVSGDLLLVVVAGLAERVNIVAGAPEEVTPDAA